ncbi:MAG: Eco57I restriction-modification methylase domain-containing protein [Acidobacteriales bacterium]|nr:Eco57I restriction-modification methylase domain-containing protein [Candidatus Koribacter versatilis]MBI3644944.1 Eco57I restriction-modification methylase domain-containing protein [Terriglobales bacterium]
MDVRAIERQRVELQANCDRQRSQADRNKLGQFATPFELAREIAATTISLVGGKSIRFLDPAFGTGAFFSALLDVAGDRIESAMAFEVDPHYGTPALCLWNSTGLKLRVEDFTRASVDQSHANLVICNPPYVRHHHLSVAKKAALRRTSHALGVKLNGLAGLYCYFMIFAHQWLEADAVCAWLVPSEFMDVNYGEAIKHYLLNTVTLVRIHRFDPNETQFSDALVSSAVVWFKNQKPDPTALVSMTFGGTVTGPRISRDITLTEMHSEAKWTRLPEILHHARDRAPGVRLGDLFAIKRGIATGNNQFFILTEGQVTELGLTQAFLKPILPSPRYLKQDEIEGDKDGAPTLDRRLFLIDCALSESEVEKIDPGLGRYLKSGRHTVAQGYLCKSRSPWYAQERRPPAPFLCTYMGRTNESGKNAFRFILNRSKATAANVYLLLYPKPAIRAALEDDRVLRRVFQLLKSIPVMDMSTEGRVYGGGLHKLEPGELSNVRADHVGNLLLGENSRPRGEQMTFSLVG